MKSSQLVNYPRLSVVHEVGELGQELEDIKKERNQIYRSSRMLGQLMSSETQQRVDEHTHNLYIQENMLQEKLIGLLIQVDLTEYLRIDLPGLKREVEHLLTLNG